MGEKTDQTEADAKWWREFGKLFGWRLHGFSGREVATLVTVENPCSTLTARSAHLTLFAHHREAIERAIEAARRG